ncbi:MAG TPA: signal peptidase [Paraburkholderia sp.]|nr:signal peptidase [Paraburkholderia sp.]
MKKTLVWGVLAAVVLTQAGCATQVKSLPLAAAGGESRGGVPVYFGQQNHPAVKSQLGDVSYSVRIARKVSGPDDACHEALAEAVQKLRAAARERNANAVIDVSTRFHSTESNSSAEFTCGVSPSAAAIAVSGRLVVLEAN